MMEYKICENCNEKLHPRTQKCPLCNTILTEKSQIVKEEETVIETVATENLGISNEQENMNNQDVNQNTESNKNETIVDEIVKNNFPDKEIKDYVYKAEVRHSLEYTKLMSNSLKVFLTAISMIPIIGQIIGTFFGVLFLTYEDTDRNSFGKALIVLSIIMFAIYAYNVWAYTEILKTEGFSALLEGMK